MSSSKKKWIVYLWGFFLFCNGVLVNSTLSDSSKDLQQNRAKGYSKYPEHYRLKIWQLPNNSFTGFRSVFQWTIGDSFEHMGIHNAMEFLINDTVNLNAQLSGQIGLYSNGSQIGVHLSLDSLASSSPGPSFTCSNDFPFFIGSHACFNSNYSIVSNAIYFLDVEIRGKTVRGYISYPLKDLSDINDPYLPRNLIGEFKWANELRSLAPQAYWVANYYGTSCDYLSDMTTVNYAPESYNKLERKKNTYARSESFSLRFCEPQNTIAITDFGKYIGVYISRHSPQIVDSRSKF